MGELQEYCDRESKRDQRLYDLLLPVYNRHGERVSELAEPVMKCALEANGTPTDQMRRVEIWTTFREKRPRVGFDILYQPQLTARTIYNCVAEVLNYYQHLATSQHVQIKALSRNVLPFIMGISLALGKYQRETENDPDELTKIPRNYRQADFQTKELSLLAQLETTLSAREEHHSYKGLLTRYIETANLTFGQGKMR